MAVLGSSPSPIRPRHGRAAAGLLVSAVALALATGVVATGTGTTGAATRGAAATGAAATGHHGGRRSGSVVVLSAGSLETIMKTAVEPGFHRATGLTVTDISGGSTGLAQEIKGGVHRADVFWSAAAASDRALMGQANGSWVRWYLTFATTPLVLGFERSDRFAAKITSEPWWKVITTPGFLVGRTNPATDPKGRLTVAALRKAAEKDNAPKLRAIVERSTTVFTETSLVGRLQAGQLDAGFFYAVEASSAHFPTVPLTGTTERAEYTLTVVAKAPHARAAAAFVAWLLSPAAKRELAAHGLRELTRPVLSGSRSAVPRRLLRVITS